MYARYVERLWKEKERRMERMLQPRIKRGSEMRSFKSSENIHKKEGGSYYVVSASDPVITRQQKPEETYCNFANFK